MLLEMTAAALGKLNERCDLISFVNPFTTMHVNLEALGSSAIEGTHAEPKELSFSEKIDNKTIDKEVLKVRNLRNATYRRMNENAPNFEYTTENLEAINFELFQGLEAETKEVGKIRTCQNFVGGTNIMNALFTPPPPEYVKELIEDLNDYWNDKSYSVPNLIKIALYHFQFETIHPFIDGNGRMGRMLINIQLRDCGLLDFPVLCLSNYWRRNKGLYFEALSAARFSHNIEHWIRFFLDSIMNAANERHEMIIEIQNLINNCKKELIKQGKYKGNYKEVLHYLTNISPYVTVRDLQEHLNMSYQGTYKIIETFINLGILEICSEGARNREFVFRKFNDMFYANFD